MNANMNPRTNAIVGVAFGLGVLVGVILSLAFCGLVRLP